MDQHQPGRRPHYHRGRRGPDRRGSDRRATATHDTPARAADQVDVEQIMRDIRARIAQRSGVELTTQQIQELAARRLEAILDPRAVSPSLMQQLRRSAGTAPDIPAPSIEPPYTFEAETLYESHRGLLRFIRKLLNPLLKLFFNPTPLIHALHTQARLNREAAAREAERERLQTEWNALHYEVLQRLVTEVSRVSIEMQDLALRVESLATRVDFADRRVRVLEAGTPAASRPAARPAEPAAVPAPAAAQAEPASAETSATEGAPGEGTRRRRRRRRGRRGGAGTDAASAIVVGGSEALAGPDTADLAEGPDDGDDDGGAGQAAVSGEPEEAALEAVEGAAATSFEPAPPEAATPDASAPAPAAAAEPGAEARTDEPEPHLSPREGLAQGAPPTPDLPATDTGALPGTIEEEQQPGTTSPELPEQPGTTGTAPPEQPGTTDTVLSPTPDIARTADTASQQPDAPGTSAAPKQADATPPPDSAPLHQGAAPETTDAAAARQGDTSAGTAAAPGPETTDQHAAEQAPAGGDTGSARPEPLTTPPPDEPVAQPAPRDPGPPDR